MYARFFYICVFAFLNMCYVNGQVICFGYDNNGNRTQRCIDPGKGDGTGIGVVDKPLSESVEEELKKEYKEVLEEITVKIYPNPTKGYLSVELSGILPEEYVGYQVISQTGNVLEIKNNIGNPFNIDFSVYQNGIYFLKLDVNGKISQWKILKK